MSTEQQLERRRRRAQATNGSVASRAKRKRTLWQRDADSQGSETQIYSGPNLPEHIWCHIHSRMPMRAAARVACVSRAFVCSWRCHPNLTFSKETLGLNKMAYGNDDTATDFCSKVDQILKRHSGIGVKKLKIYIPRDFNAKHICYLDNWLHIAVTPGIEELTFAVPMLAKYKYNFPGSLLCKNGVRDSIWYLRLHGCAFRPTSDLGWLTSLRKLYLHDVCITGDELECLLCNSLLLEWLEVRYCDEIVCLKVPCVLQRLRYLGVFGCGRLKVISNKAPNLSSFFYEGEPGVQLLFGEALQMKNLDMTFSGSVHYFRVQLPSSMPNLKTASIYSIREMVNTPMLHSKYLHLKKLNICLSFIAFPPAYDYCSLVSFFDACPSLESLFLNVSQCKMEHVSIFTDPSDLRKMPGQQHHKMKRVEILGFTSAKSLVELTCHVVESITSLQRLTLDAGHNSLRCFVPAHKVSKCSPLSNDVLIEAQRALLAINTGPKFPPW